MAQKRSKPAPKPAVGMVADEAPQRCGNYWIRPSAVNDIVDLGERGTRIELCAGHGVPGANGDEVSVTWLYDDVRRVFGM